MVVFSYRMNYFISLEFIQVHEKTIRGVQLICMGIHVDMVCWWLGRMIRYASEGGGGDQGSVFWCLGAEGESVVPYRIFNYRRTTGAFWPTPQTIAGVRR